VTGEPSLSGQLAGWCAGSLTVVHVRPAPCRHRISNLVS